MDATGVLFLFENSEKLLFRAKYQDFERKVKGFPQDVKANVIIRGEEKIF